MQVNRIANTTITTGQKKSTYLISCSKKVQVWHRKFEYASNIRIICILKSLTRMGDFTANYNLAKIYNNFEASESKDLTIDNANLPSK